MHDNSVTVGLASPDVVDVGNFIPKFSSIKSPILAVTHAFTGKVVVWSLCCSRGPHINIHDVCGLYMADYSSVGSKNA